MDTHTVEYGSFAFACAVISARWAMDLGYSQARQMLFGIGGLLLGPLMLLILYVRLLYQAKADGKPAAKMGWPVLLMLLIVAGVLVWLSIALVLMNGGK